MDIINVVVWSGGKDSTLILDQLCSANIKNCVWAFSINWDLLNSLKTKKEKEARKNYLKYAKAKGYSIAHRTISVTANMGSEHIGNAQAVAWFSYVIPYLPKESNLYLGYHNADRFWEDATKFSSYIDAIAAVGERTISLQYPLQFMSKHDILKEHKARGIPASCTWTCESPKRKGRDIISCGKCPPCIALRTVVYESKLWKRRE